MTIVPEKWLREPDNEGSGLLLAHAENGAAYLPMAIETHGVDKAGVTLEEAQDFELVFESAGDVGIYRDEDDYLKRSGSTLAPESFIPSGTFSVGGDPGFEETATAVVTGKITETYGDPEELGFDAGDTVFTLTCLGYELDAVVHSEDAPPVRPAEGNTVSGVFWIQGWPKEE